MASRPLAAKALKLNVTKINKNKFPKKTSNNIDRQMILIAFLVIIMKNQGECVNFIGKTNKKGDLSRLFYK